MFGRDGHCLVCNSAGWRRLGEDEGSEVVRCGNCGLVKVHPLPGEDELLALYRAGVDLRAPRALPLPRIKLQEDQIEGPSDSGTIRVASWKQKEQRRILADLARLGLPAGRLLDIGCLWGLFVMRAAKRGYQAEGVEPMFEAAEYGRRAGLRVFSGTLGEAAFPPEAFDVVTLLDVLEHLVAPPRELAECWRVLRPGGLLVVGTPNLAGFLPGVSALVHRAAGRNWVPVRPPWHLYGFAPRSLRLLLRRAGFDVVRVRMIGSLRTVRSKMDKHPAIWLAEWLLSGLGELVGMGDRIMVYARKVAVGPAGPRAG